MEMKEKINLQVITLAAYYDMLCKEKAIDEELFHGDEEEWAREINTRAWRIMDSSSVYVRQHVSINKDGIIVVIDTKEITDDSIEEAIALVKAVNDTGQTYFEFGPAKSYRSYEIVNQIEGSKYRKCTTELKRTLYKNFETLQ